jgi:phage terminase small subunit
MAFYFTENVMARQDWGALQKQFLAEHARTGVSPEDWCKEQGLKYSTAKRHIKIGNRVANSQKKTANKKANGEVRKTEQKPTESDTGGAATANANEGEAQENPSILKPQHEQFAQNIAQGMPAKDAAVCAGYSPARAESQASILLRRTDVKARIQELRNDAALLVSFNAGHLAELSYKSAQQALKKEKFGQVAPNIKNAAQLTGIDMSTNKTEVTGANGGPIQTVNTDMTPEEAAEAYHKLMG